MARRLTRTIMCAGFGRLLRIVLGGPASEECPGCGLDYDPGTGQVLPVCEGLPPPRGAKILPSRPPGRALVR